jgi:cyclophilin family peptidyl-prolyl cis-trans isomerase
MPNAKRTRKQLSKQERVQRQNAAREAARTRKQRRGIFAGVALGLVAILFVFGVVGTNPRNDKPKKNVTPTTVAGQILCPNEDGSSKRQTLFDHEPPRCVDSTAVYVATIKTTAGTMTAELYPGRAFKAVNNFVFLARYHFYDGLPFHRVFQDAFAQTGDPLNPGVTGPGYEFADDGLPSSSSAYVKGAILFAHDRANTNGSQILFIIGPNGQTLNPTFPLFGQVKKGLDVLDRINRGANPKDIGTPNARYSIIGVDIVKKDA